MTQLIAPAPNDKHRRNFFILGFTLLTLAAAITVGGLILRDVEAQNDREQWLESAYRGYHNVKEFCANRQIFGYQSEPPPLVQFYLNQDGAFDDAYAAWEISHNGKSIVYRLQVQFADFDDEMLTRIAALDSRIDDGDLFSGKLQLSKSGFACVIQGPVSTSEQFVGNYSGNTTVNPI